MTRALAQLQGNQQVQQGERFAQWKHDGATEHQQRDNFSAVLPQPADCPYQCGLRRNALCFKFDYRKKISDEEHDQARQGDSQQTVDSAVCLLIQDGIASAAARDGAVRQADLAM